MRTIMDQDKIFKDKSDFIAWAHSDLDKRFNGLSSDLLDLIIDSFFDKLDKSDNGYVLTNSTNFNLVLSIDKVYQTFVNEYFTNVIQTMVDNIVKIGTYNVDYFGTFDTDNQEYKNTTQKVQKIIRDRLGITADGNGKRVTLVKDGYMASLLADTSVRNQIKQISYQEVLKGSGFINFKNKLKQFIEGDQTGKLGGFEQYFRQYSYDIYAQVDRSESSLYAKDLGLKYFIFEGSIIETSRYFCTQRAGKVFSSKDADKWKDLIGKYAEVPDAKGKVRRQQIGPIVALADKENYKWSIQMGGFGCRHIPRYISEELAKKLNPNTD